MNLFIYYLFIIMYLLIIINWVYRANSDQFWIELFRISIMYS